MISHHDIKIVDLAEKCSFIDRIALAKADFVASYTEYFGRQFFMSRLDLEHVCLLLILLEYKMQRGDVCLRLQKPVLEGIVDEFERYVRLLSDEPQNDAAEFVKFARVLLKGMDIDDLVERNREFFALDNPKSVLVTDRGRLYMRRYYNYEKNIADLFAGEEGRIEELDLPKAKELVSVLYPDGSGEVNWQKVAACLALLKRCAIISGGPGTGKTTTVLYILLLLSCLSDKVPRIALAAPTGKAAARMSESILRGMEGEGFRQLASELAAHAGMGAEDLIGRIPRQAQTLHSLIKIHPHKSGATFNRGNRLRLDILILDEVSMVDLSLFNKMLEALDDGTRLVMLGDKDQLCSVEAGSILGDLCADLNSAAHVSDQLMERLSALSGYPGPELRGGRLCDYAVLLQKSYRFDAASGIGRLAGIVNAEDNSGKAQAIDGCFGDPDFAGHLERRDLGAGDNDEALGGLIDESLRQEVEDNYAPYLKRLKGLGFRVSTDEEIGQVFADMDLYRILCSNHTGTFGDRRINKYLEERVREEAQRTLKQDFGEFYPGRMLMITRNDPSRNIYNGDVGFVAMDGNDEDRLKFFVKNETGFVRILPVFLQDYEPGFAITIHKSQGSEYRHVNIVLSPEYNSVLTRELVYTAITRARDKITLYATPEVLGRAVSHRVDRESALSERLASAV